MDPALVRHVASVLVGSMDTIVAGDEVAAVVSACGSRELRMQVSKFEVAAIDKLGLSVDKESEGVVGFALGQDGTLVDSEHVLEAAMTVVRVVQVAETVEVEQRESEATPAWTEGVSNGAKTKGRLIDDLLSNAPPRAAQCGKIIHR